MRFWVAYAACEKRPWSGCHFWLKPVLAGGSQGLRTTPRFRQNLKVDRKWAAPDRGRAWTRPACRVESRDRPDDSLPCRGRASPAVGFVAACPVAEPVGVSVVEAGPGVGSTELVPAADSDALSGAGACIGIGCTTKSESKSGSCCAPGQGGCANAGCSTTTGDASGSVSDAAESGTRTGAGVETNGEGTRVKTGSVFVGLAVGLSCSTV